MVSSLPSLPWEAWEPFAWLYDVGSPRMNGCAGPERVGGGRADMSLETAGWVPLPGRGSGWPGSIRRVCFLVPTQGEEQLTCSISTCLNLEESVANASGRKQIWHANCLKYPRRSSAPDIPKDARGSGATSLAAGPHHQQRFY